MLKKLGTALLGLLFATGLMLPATASAELHPAATPAHMEQHGYGDHNDFHGHHHHHHHHHHQHELR